ncbi:MAG: hypothetical protein ACREQ4_15360 [Candidatus Binataceae bacterium]
MMAGGDGVKVGVAREDGLFDALAKTLQRRVVTRMLRHNREAKFHDKLPGA